MNIESFCRARCVALLAPGAIALAACDGPERQPLPPPVVIIAKPEVRDVTTTRTLIGTTEAGAFVEVRARVPGFLQSMEFTPGALVEEGQLLFTIERDQFEAALARANAALAIQEAELARAEADLARVEEAIKTNAVSKQEVDLRRADRNKAAAALESARAEVRANELDLSYTEIRAPVAGKVGREMVPVGNLVGAGGQTTLLTTIADVQPIYVYFDVPEPLVVQYLRDNSARPLPPEESRERYPVHVALEGDEGFPYEGWIDFVDNTLDPATGTIRGRARVPNEDLKIIPGLFARVRMSGDSIENAIVVEEQAIGTDLGGKFVLVIGEENVVERRYVTLGQSIDGKRVILDGIDANATYIVDGLVKARPGLPVMPLTREQAAGARQDAAGAQQGR